jgi:predicted RNase H-like HicB family nuclease
VIGPVRLCPGNEGEYTATLPVGVTRTWSFDDAVMLDSAGMRIRIIWLSPGIRRVRVADSNVYTGCTGYDDITVEIVAASKPTISVLRPTRFCDGDSTAFAVASPYRSVQWSTGDTSHAISVKKTGVYFARVTDINGCIANTDSVAVTVLQRPAPRIRPLRPTMFCDGDSTVLELFAGLPIVHWSTGDIGHAITVRASGFYTAAVVDSNGCSGQSDTVRVEVRPLPKVAIHALGPTVFCEGDSTVLELTAGFPVVRWSTGDTAHAITVRESGLYLATVVDSNGCSGRSDTLRVVAMPGPMVAIRALGPTEFCTGDSVTLDAGAGYARYRWLHGDTTRWITVKSSGDFVVTVWDIFGCVATSTPVTVIVHPLPDVPVIVRVADSLLTDDANAWQWFLDSTRIAGGRYRSLDIQEPGWYSVEVTNAFGCRRRSPPFWADLATAEALIAFPVIDAAPGDEIDIPVIIPSSSRLLAKGPQTLDIVAEIPSTMFVPDAGQFLWTASDSMLRFTMRCIVTDSVGSVMHIRGRAALGNRLEGPLRIRSATWSSKPVRTTMRDGLLRIAVCREGGPRLVDLSAPAMRLTVAPNPFNAMTRISFHAIEIGRVTIFVYDMHGRNIAMPFDAPCDPGDYSVLFDAGTIPSGMYIVELRTPSVSVKRFMSVVR